MYCKHQHGAFIEALGAWTCGQCFKMLTDRPKRYGIPSVPIRGAGSPTPPQEIVWQAEVKKSSEGTNLETFVNAVARRFMSRCQALETREAHKIALAVVRSLGAEFGHPDHDWSRASAIDIADEEMTYWDEEPQAGN